NFMERDRGKLVAQARTMDEDPVVGRVCELAAELGIWVLLGSVVVVGEAGRLVNRSVLVAADGGIAATYDKMHLFDLDLADGRSVRESDTFAAGSGLTLAETPWGRLGLTICYDVRFPYLYRGL